MHKKESYSLVNLGLSDFRNNERKIEIAMRSIKHVDLIVNDA